MFLLKIAGAHRIKMLYLPGAFVSLASYFKNFQVKINMDILSAREMSCFFSCAISSLRDINVLMLVVFWQKSLIGTVPSYIGLIMYYVTSALALDRVTSLLYESMNWLAYIYIFLNKHHAMMEFLIAEPVMYRSAIQPVFVECFLGMSLTETRSNGQDT